MHSTVTSTLLLEGLKDTRNQTMWRDYVDRYRPMLVRYAQRLGLNAADAEDVAQQTLAAFASSYRAGKYDRERGRLRAWLFGIARTTIRNWHSRQRAREVQAPTSEFARIEDENHLQQLWEEEWEQAVLGQCLLLVRQEISETTFLAFDRFARQGQPAKTVAMELGLSENAVFGAKRRVLRRIRELLPEVQENW